MVKLSGGGIQSNKYVTSKAGQKVEPVSKAANVAGVAQQGLSTAFRKEPLEQGKGYSADPMKDTGIAKATYNSAREGPGSQRTTYRSGSQCPTPSATPMAPGRDTLAEFGPEISGPSRRR